MVQIHLISMLFTNEYLNFRYVLLGFFRDKKAHLCVQVEHILPFVSLPFATGRDYRK